MPNDGTDPNQDRSRPVTRAEMEAMAYRNGWEIRFQGEVLNPGREKRPDFPASSPATTPGSNSPITPAR